ncbi:Phospholipase A(1) LCAT3, partial [Cucurbita argyrosperma subsp. argyrosperma]
MVGRGGGGGGGGGGFFLPCFGSWMPESEPEPDRDPVLLVSGIGGSIIHAKNKKLFGLQTRVWVRIFLSDLVFRENLISIYNPGTAFLVDSAVMELRYMYEKSQDNLD